MWRTAQQRRFGQGAGAARGDPMHILCGGPAGSIPDLFARAVADQLIITLGLRAVIDRGCEPAGPDTQNASASVAVMSVATA